MLDKKWLNLRSAASLNATAVLWCGYFLVMIILASKVVSADSDLVLHICYGRSLLESGFPESDPFLSGITDAPVLQEWGFEIIVALLDRISGLGGPLIAFACLLATLFAWLFQRMRLNSCFWLSIIYTNLIFFALFPHLIIRPHMISWFAAALLWSFLEDFQEGKRSFRTTAVFSCLLMLIWTNLHGGFLIAAALASVMIAGEALNCIQGKSSKFLPMTILFCIITSVTLLNPWGGYLHEHLVSFLSNDFLIKGTSDFQPPSFAERTMQPLLLTALMAVFPMLLNWRRVKAQEWLLLIALVTAAFTSVRNIPFLGILMLPIAVRHLQFVLQIFDTGFVKTILSSSARIEAGEQGKQGWLWGAGLLLIAIIFIGTGFYRFTLSSSIVPVKAIEWVQQNDVYSQRPVFADFLAAGFLLYETPVQHVYLHALNANYPEERLRTWVSVGCGEEGWDQKLQGLQWAFLLKGSPQAETLMTSNFWQPLYEDNDAIIFERICL